MCQLCHIAAISNRDRWPNPLEPSLADLQDILKRAHPDAEMFNSRNNQPGGSDSGGSGNSEAAEQKRHTLTTTVRMVLTALSLLESEQEEWWKAKAARRRAWADAGEQQKLTQLQIVNNKVQAMVRDMRAKVGVFARWTLDVRDVEGLE